MLTVIRRVLSWSLHSTENMKADYLSIIAKLCTLLILFGPVANVYSLDIRKYKIYKDSLFNIYSEHKNASIAV